MPTAIHPIEQLEKIANEFHHWSNEYKHEGEEGSTRRTIEKHLEELDERFNHLLSHWVSNEPKRKEWYEHLHHDAPKPDDDLSDNPPVFVGRSASGSELQVRPNRDGLFDIMIDGAVKDRMSTELTISQNMPVLVLGQEWVETSNTHEYALDALRRYCADEKGRGTPPWEWSRVLFNDGLIDVNFGLTDRGRRIINR